VHFGERPSRQDLHPHIEHVSRVSLIHQPSHTGAAGTNKKGSASAWPPEVSPVSIFKLSHGLTFRRFKCARICHPAQTRPNIFNTLKIYSTNCPPLTAGCPTAKLCS